MSAVIIETLPQCEPVDLATVKNALRVIDNNDDGLLAIYIEAARRMAEEFCRRSFINKGYAQFLDSFPYFIDTITSQMAYSQSYYQLPRYSITFWNYYQMIKLFYGRLASVSSIRYVASATGLWTTLNGTADVSLTTANFLYDVNSEPGRIFPNAQQNWPSVLYVPNSVEVHYVAGYNNETTIATAVAAWKTANPNYTADQASAYEAGLRQADVPASIKVAVMELVSHFYENRESVSGLNLKEIPLGAQSILWSERIEDFQPTRG